MELRHLRYFLSAGEHLQFGRAARALGVRQPTISRQVRALEDQLGVSLFDRHPRGIRLTYAGRALFTDAQRIITDLDRAEQRALRAGRAEIGTLRIAFYSSLVGGNLTGLLREHRSRWPEVDLVLVEADPVHQLSLLAERRIDLAVLAAEDAHRHPDLESAAWWTERVFVALPEGHALTGRSSVSWVDLRDETFVVRAYETGPVIYNWLARRVAPNRLLPKIQQQDISREGLLGLVEAGFGLTIVSEPATLLGVPGVIYRPITDDNAQIGIRAAWLRENINPVLRRFLSFVPQWLKRHPVEHRASQPPRRSTVRG